MFQSTLNDINFEPSKLTNFTYYRIIEIDGSEHAPLAFQVVKTFVKTTLLLGINHRTSLIALQNEFLYGIILWKRLKNQKQNIRNIGHLFFNSDNNCQGR